MAFLRAGKRFGVPSLDEGEAASVKPQEPDTTIPSDEHPQLDLREVAADAGEVLVGRLRGVSLVEGLGQVDDLEGHAA